MTVPAILDAVAERTPDAPALACPDGRLTHGELREASRRAAQELLEHGVAPGDRVAFLLADGSAHQIVTLVGALRLGAVAVCLNARFKGRELAHALERVDAALLVTVPWFHDVLAGVAPRCAVVDLAQLEGRDAGADLARLESAVGPETPARVIFTSGTTAFPKGCLHDHRALVAQAHGVAGALRLTAEDRYWTPLPLFHTAGWTMLAPLSRGASFHHLGRFEAGAALEQIERERCTVLFPGFETIWMPVLTHPRFAQADLAAARLVLNVGSPERMRVMQDLLPHAPQVSNTGCTEASGWLAIGDPDDDAATRAVSCGRPLPGMEVRIADPEDGGPVGDDVPGELLFRGPSRIREYFGDPEGTAVAIDADGWFHTGDLVARRADGNLVFHSRLKDMLKVGGENVAAAEIEDHLLAHRAVLLAQVVSAPDARYGEVPAAFVQLHPGAEATEDELVEHCIGAIATFKVPRYVRFVVEWPMSGTKIKKTDLRARIAAELDAAGTTEARPPTRP